ncbi:RuvC family protein [Mycobacterium avium]|uniref:hypothetical protein n=1 Tax=Mycobacterium avium TaxID=1764 RepID=UPI00079FF3A4|nr:hypothetical protein [Mycobacterium avium]
MIVAGIDPSLTNTGIAVLADGNPLSLRSIGHGTLSGHSYAHRSDRIVSQCRAVIDALILADDAKPAVAVIEGPAYGALVRSSGLRVLVSDSEWVPGWFHTGPG